MKSLSVIFVMCSLLLAATSAWAEGNSIRGVVTDVKGKPVAGAEIRAERTDAKGPPAVAITDAKGQYMLNHLAVGTYKVIASVSKTPRSAASVKTSSAGWAEVDFALKDSFARPQRRDQSATDRVQGQDLRRMQQDQAFSGGFTPGR
jgi:Carboxypeptidase regulatory-like domain